MYLREAHAELDISILREFIQTNPLGILTTALPSANFPLLQSSFIPWLFDFNAQDSGDLGLLRGHMARANPHAKALMEFANSRLGSTEAVEVDIMLLFNGPAHHYVTPKFYTDTKPATGKVVPTWNYSAVEVRGKALIPYDYNEPSTTEYLIKQTDDLSRLAEVTIMGYRGSEGASPPWSASESPKSYIDTLRKAIIGVEIKVESMVGRFKMSQEMGSRDRQGVIEGFTALDTEVGHTIAKTVDERGKLKDARKTLA